MPLWPARLSTLFAFSEMVRGLDLVRNQAAYRMGGWGKVRCCNGAQYTCSTLSL